MSIEVVLRAKKIKSALRVSSLILVLASTSAFKKNDVVIIQKEANARASMNFTRSSKNIKFSIKSGTIARVETYTPLGSGNYGVYVELMGPEYENKHPSERMVWLYDRKNRDDDIRKCADKICSQEVEELKEASHTQAITDQVATSNLESTPASPALGSMVTNARSEIQNYHSNPEVEASYNCSPNADTRTCMICNCFYETRGEPLEGKVAINLVALSRLNDIENLRRTRYNHRNVCEVIYEPDQFSWTPKMGTSTIRTSTEPAAVKECVQSVDYITQFSNIRGPLWFHAKSVFPKWSRRLNRVTAIDNHIFFSARGEPTNFRGDRQTLANASPSSPIERQGSVQ